MKSRRTVIILAGLSHALAWAAFLGMAFSPSFYRGTTIVATGPDGSGGDVVDFTASIIAVNGWWVLIPLLIPVALSAIGLLAAITWEPHQSRNKIFLWVAAILLVAFCGLGLFSIGMFYLPAALTLAAAATIAALMPRGFAAPRY